MRIDDVLKNIAFSPDRRAYSAIFDVDGTIRVQHYAMEDCILQSEEELQQFIKDKGLEEGNMFRIIMVIPDEQQNL